MSSSLWQCVSRTWGKKCFPPTKQSSDFDLYLYGDKFELACGKSFNICCYFFRLLVWSHTTRTSSCFQAKTRGKRVEQWGFPETKGNQSAFCVSPDCCCYFWGKEIGRWLLLKVHPPKGTRDKPYLKICLEYYAVLNAAGVRLVAGGKEVLFSLTPRWDARNLSASDRGWQKVFERVNALVLVSLTSGIFN